MILMTKNETHREIAVFAGLLLFGFIYNALVEYLERHRYEEGYVSLLVAFGSGVTIICSIPLVGWRKAKKILGCFIASGTPMILGSLWRHAKERAEQEKRRQKWGKWDGDAEEGRGL